MDRSTTNPRLVGVLVALALFPLDRAAHGITFTEADDAATTNAIRGYRRAPSVPEHDLTELNRQLPVVTLPQLMFEPLHDRGLPGVVIFDYDGDGDQDVYVTNGPGGTNRLLRNDGTASFTDVAASAGVELVAVDANGACAGDTDNDGDPDLYVLGRDEPNHFFRNNRNEGNGTFTDVTAAAGLDGGRLSHVSCSMGDVDNDGLLDVVVANNFNMITQPSIFVVPYGLNEPNQLFRNLSGNAFEDVSRTSGLNSIDVSPDDTALGAAEPQVSGPFFNITWAISMVDYDQDGNIDILEANDQAALPRQKYGGLDRGFIRVFKGDGAGRFTDVTHEVGLNKSGGWMGLSFGDLNCDGRLDLFASNVGDYMLLLMPEVQNEVGDFSSRWFLGGPAGTFIDPRDPELNGTGLQGDPSLGGLVAMPFGWGTSMFDYDNDGDTDVLYHGGLDTVSWVGGDNPGALLQNKGCDSSSLIGGFFPSFAYDALAVQRDHRERLVNGVATGDLNGDGFLDVVSAAQSLKEGFPVSLTLYKDEPLVGGLPASFSGSPFNDRAGFLKEYERLAPPVALPVPPAPIFTPTGKRTSDGDLSVELNSADNGNGWLKVRVVGDGTTVNRDGVGAVVKVTPAGGNTQIFPVLAGSSFLSQNSLELGFGLGNTNAAEIEVLWPGGSRTCVQEVSGNQTVTIPVTASAGEKVGTGGTVVPCSP